LVAEALRGGGCNDVVVVLGAGAGEAAPLVPAWVRVVVASDWAAGLSRSLAAGLDAALPGPWDAHVDALVIATVDIPDLPSSAVGRVIAAGMNEPRPSTAGDARTRARAALARATYAGRRGHPVLIGADHAGALAASLAGDTGAGPFLTRAGALGVECGDLWSGRDRDAPGRPSDAPSLFSGAVRDRTAPTCRSLRAD
ncbi:MAG: nucleotidyltransferase family protein, partial [Pseudoclavibacter sp.]